MLASKHPHTLDHRLAFDGPSHSYVVDGRVACRSVTSIVSASFAPFNPTTAIYKMRTGRQWGPNNTLFGLSDAEIVDVWTKRGDEASRAGTRLHWLIEQALNSDDPAKYALEHAGPVGHPELADGFGGFLSVVPPNAVPYRTEWRICDKANRLAGTVDAVYQLEDGTFAVYDWKRTPNIEMETPFNRFGMPPFETLHDTKGSRYRLQLNLYAGILERCYDITVSAMFIVAIHPNIMGHSFRVIQVDPLPKDAMHRAIQIN